jgi:hypothetical protein
MSLDGFIAGPNDDMSGLFGVEGGGGETVAEVLRSTGALLVGRRTQDVEDRLQPGFYGGAFRGPFFVLRHDPPSTPPVVKGVTGQFLSVDIHEAVSIAKRAAQGRDVVVLGANVARSAVPRRRSPRRDHRARRPCSPRRRSQPLRKQRREPSEAASSLVARRGRDDRAALHNPSERVRLVGTVGWKAVPYRPVHATR